MQLCTPSFSRVLKELEHWGSYESSARPRDISRLDGIRRLLKEIGQPHRQLRVIHIAGTNGKGLSALMLGKLLISEGKSCGIFSSPHLTDIRERICLNGEWISQTEFTDCAEEVLKSAQVISKEIYLSYFDMLTAIALLAFQRTGMSRVILETGLGGRADSTNVTEKELCILTQIGMDHQEVLGHSLKQIAGEKMGITRPGIPVVLARQQETLKTWMIEELEQNRVPVMDASSEMRFFPEPVKINPSSFQIDWKDGMHHSLSASDHMSVPWLECMRTTLIAAEILEPGTRDKRAERLETLRDVRIPARLELRRNVSWKKCVFRNMVLDGGHNTDSLTALAEQLLQWNFDRCVVLLGMARDKLKPELLPGLMALFRRTELLLLSPYNSPRSVAPEVLKRFLKECRELEKPPLIHCVPSPEAGMEKAREKPEQPLIVAGSLYLAGEIMILLEGKSKTDHQKL